uniref:Uncharacterized protein n=1 Tax=Rhizophora mucronata TaxID=61149 RepID=A0A2P2IT73_RHIMU
MYIVASSEITELWQLNASKHRKDLMLSPSFPKRLKCYQDSIIVMLYLCLATARVIARGCWCLNTCLMVT